MTHPMIGNMYLKLEMLNYKFDIPEYRKLDIPIAY